MPTRSTHSPVGSLKIWGVESIPGRTVLLGLGALLVLTFGGCSRIYLPGGYDLGPVETTPLVTDVDRQRVALAFNRSGGYNSDEENTSTELSYAISDGGSWYRGMVRGFAYSGLYRINGTYRDRSGLQSYVGFGLILDGNAHLSIENVSLGLGGEFGGLAEFGPYTHLITSEELSHLFPLFQAYGFVEIATDEESSIGLKGALGVPGGGHLGLHYFHGRWGGGLGIGPGSDDPVGRLTLGLSYGL